MKRSWQPEELIEHWANAYRFHLYPGREHTNRETRFDKSAGWHRFLGKKGLVVQSDRVSFSLIGKQFSRLNCTHNDYGLSGITKFCN